jgi:hypothetical protein
MIIPITDMREDGPTVFYAKGFHQHWEELTRKVMEKKDTRAWKTTNPMNVFRKEDFKTYITDEMVPMVAAAGDVVIFSALLPHGPNLNTSEIRIAAYNFYAPLITMQDPLCPSSALSFLPNSLNEVQQSILDGRCPNLIANAWLNGRLSDRSKSFVPALPTYRTNRTSLDNCLHGFMPWSTFETSEEATWLYNQDPAKEQDRRHHIKMMQYNNIVHLQECNNWMEEAIQRHRSCFTRSCENCVICQRMASLSIEAWWHTTEGARHAFDDTCCCLNCQKVKQLEWNSWATKGGCTCSICKPKPSAS